MRAVASVQSGHPLVAVAGLRVQLRRAVRRDDGRPRIRDRDDRLSGPRDPGLAHVREPDRRGQCDAGCQPSRDALTGYLIESAWASCILGLLTRRRGGSLGGRVGAVVCAGALCRGDVRWRAAGGSEGTVPVCGRQRARWCGRLRAQLCDHDIPGVRGGHPLDADSARCGPALQGPGPVHRRDHHQVHVSAPAALLQTPTSPRWSTKSRTTHCSICSESAATNPMRRR